jgi:hypothetical protein
VATVEQAEAMVPPPEIQVEYDGIVQMQKPNGEALATRHDRLFLHYLLYQQAGREGKEPIYRYVYDKVIYVRLERLPLVFSTQVKAGGR